MSCAANFAVVSGPMSSIRSSSATSAEALTVAFASAAKVFAVKAAADVADDDLILDIGPETTARLAAQLKTAGTIVWNGPVGVFEFDAFAKGTEGNARAIAGSDAFSIAGGGAFLEVLEGKTLPAFEILQKRAAG